MLVSFTDSDGDQILIDPEQIAVVSKLNDEKDVCAINIYVGGVRGFMRIFVRDTMDEILNKVNSVYED